MRWPKPRLRTLLILSNVLILLSPLAGIQLLRWYESALVRQTEAALITQGAFVAAAYRALLLETYPGRWSLASLELIATDAAEQRDGGEGRTAELDLATSPILPPFPAGHNDRAALPLAATAGERLQAILNDARSVTRAGVRITDAQGVIIATTGTDNGRLISAGEELRSALAGQRASRLRYRTELTDRLSIDSLPRTNDLEVFVAVPILLKGRLVGTVLLSQTPPNIVQTLYANRWLLMQAFAALLFLTWLLSLFASRLVTRPIAQLAERASRIATGHADELTPLLRARTHEIAKLQEAILAMTERLARRAAALEDFSRHVSHEFKTPITSIRGAVEVLEDHGDAMTAAQRARFLTNISADTERLQQLTQRLLDLTRAEVAPPAQSSEFTVRPVIEALIRAFTRPGLILRWHDPLDTPPVRGTAETLTAALECLLDNAEHHGATAVELRLAVTPEQLRLSVTDNGDGISAGNREKVFDPFFTTRRESGGTGLGLPIAKKLLAQTGGELTLAPDTEAPGTTFIIILHYATARASLPAARQDP